MDVTIIGTGNMARGIGARLVDDGNGVTLVAREAEQGAQLAKELEEAGAGRAAVKAIPVGDPLPDDVVILAVPYGSIPPVVETYGSSLAGRVVVDITNPFNETGDGLATPPDSSAAEEIAKLLPGARVVKAFNTTFAGTLATGQVGGHALDVLIAGDDAEARATVAELVAGGGLRPIEVGPLSRARLLESAQLLHAFVQDQIGTGWMSTLKFLG